MSESVPQLRRSSRLCSDNSNFSPRAVPTGFTCCTLLTGINLLEDKFASSSNSAEERTKRRSGIAPVACFLREESTVMPPCRAGRGKWLGARPSVERRKMPFAMNLPLCHEKLSLAHFHKLCLCPWPTTIIINVIYVILFFASIV